MICLGELFVQDILRALKRQCLLQLFNYTLKFFLTKYNTSQNIASLVFVAQCCKRCIAFE